MNGLWIDLRYALRGLRRSPGLVLAVVLTMTIGIAATTVVFSMVHAVIIRPLPYETPDRLVWIRSRNIADGVSRSINPLDLADWRARARVFAGLAAYYDTYITVATGADPERVIGAYVSPDYFDLLGVDPTHGRAFASGEDSWGDHRVVVLRHDFWRTRFGADPDILGRSIDVEGEPHEVIGVMPAGWPGGWSQVQLWLPLSFHPESWRMTDRNTRWMDGAVARLLPGRSLGEATRELDGIAADLALQHPESNDGIGVLVVPLRDSGPSATSRQSLVLLQVAVGIVLLIGCANIANLLLARSTSRDREFGVRSALGASRLCLARQLLVESGLLGLLGGLGGVLLTVWTLEPITSIASREIFGLETVRINPWLLAFGLLLSLVTGLLFGLAPLARVSGVSPAASIKIGGGGASPPGPQLAFLGGQVALAVVLVVAAGLVIASLARLQRVDLGFRPEGMLALRVSLLETDYPTEEAARSFYRKAVEDLRALPGVESATTTLFEMPLRGGTWGTGFGVVGRPVPSRSADIPSVRLGMVGPDYFRVLGAPLMRGREFSEQDGPGTPIVAVINRTAARRYFGDDDPVGQRIWIFDPNDTVATIIGVAPDLRQRSVVEPAEPSVLVPIAQGIHGYPSTQWILARTPIDPTSLISPVREAIRALDGRSPIDQMVPMTQVVRETLGREHLMRSLLGVFTVIALGLCALGTYGVAAYSVGRQTRAIGIRMALGARPRHVVAMILGQVARATALGTIGGVLAALGLGRLMGGLLFEVSPFHPAILFAAAVTLTITALLASALPCRRAASVDPVQVIRHE